MGTFFTNLHARADAVETILEALRSARALPAYVTEPDQGWISAYPDATEGQDLRLLERIGQALSTAANTAVYASLVHDSDVWDFTIHEGGRLLDHYCSQPGYFSGKKRRPSGGKADVLLPLCTEGTSAGELEDLLKRHLTSEAPLPEALGARLTAEMERQKQWLAGSYEEMKSRLTAMGAPVPSLRAMLARLEGKTRKAVAGSGRAEAAEDLAQAFARMLGIPHGRALLGFKYISRGEAPEGFARLIRA